MSLKRRDNEDGQVDPENGIFVEMEGVLEVRFISGYDEIMERRDFFIFQNETRRIPADFCHKDMTTGEQAIFFCVVCDCELKSIVPLKSHVEGQKHIRKAMAYKQRTLGYEPDPVNQPKKIKPSAPKGRVDCNQSLQQRLEDFEGPILGLDNVTEYTNPNNRQSPPYYTCKLNGCKSAWGNSDDIFNHVKNHKHIRNFFRVIYSDDRRVNSQNKNDLLKRAFEYCLEQNTLQAKDREYDLISPCSDLKAYKELESRPMDWSEKKANLRGHGASAIGLGSANANLIPIGYKDRGLFNEEKWKDFKAPSLSEVVEDLTNSLQPELEEIEKMFKVGVEEKILIMQIDLNLEMIEMDLGETDDPEYIDLIKADEKFKKDLLALKDRVIKKFKPITSSQQRQLDRKKYTDIFKDSVQVLVLEIAESMLKGKASNDIQDIVKKIVEEKVMEIEMSTFVKKDQGEDWKNFVFRDATKTRVQKFVRKYLKQKYQIDS